MAKFLQGNDLNSHLEQILDKAVTRLILISPYIKLHDRYLSTLKSKIDSPKLEITVVFGKNEENKSKSMQKEDFNFFKEFPNIEIRYEKRLHAKYYANENSAILTSMNLYNYSQDNNIEAGILLNTTILGSLTDGLISNENTDKAAQDYFSRVIEQSDLMFERKPKCESKRLLATQKYISSETLKDDLSIYFDNLNGKSGLRSSNSKNPSGRNKDGEIPLGGFCIRTGKKIPFNPDKPLSASAYKTWNKYADTDYPEKFCHFSGEPSDGKTCVNKPIFEQALENG